MSTAKQSGKKRTRVSHDEFLKRQKELKESLHYPEGGPKLMNIEDIPVFISPQALKQDFPGSAKKESRRHHGAVAKSLHQKGPELIANARQKHSDIHSGLVTNIKHNSFEVEWRDKSQKKLESSSIEKAKVPRSFMPTFECPKMLQRSGGKKSAGGLFRRHGRNQAGGKSWASRLKMGKSKASTKPSQG